MASVVKNMPANARDARDIGSVPGSGRFPRKGNGNPCHTPTLNARWPWSSIWRVVRLKVSEHEFLYPTKLLFCIIGITKESIRYVPGKYNPYLPTRKDKLQLINWPREEPKLKTWKVKTNDIKISFLFSSYQGLPHITLMKQYEGMQHFQTGPLSSGSHRLRDAEKVVLKKILKDPPFPFSHSSTMFIFFVCYSPAKLSLEKQERGTKTH